MRTCNDHLIANEEKKQLVNTKFVSQTGKFWSKFIIKLFIII